MADPYRVVVWGPGGLGSICIREVTRMPEFALVGVLAYSEDKHGTDAGELAGIGSIGVTATTEVDAILAIECDCVLHVARDHGDYGSAEDLIRILGAGRNVVTVHPYHHLEYMDKTTCPDGVAERIARAAQQGGATFHATGIHPEFTCDRITAAMTGLCNEIFQIKVDENWDVSFVSFEHLSLLGFGHPPEYAREHSPARFFSANYCQQNLHGLASTLGVPLVRTEAEYDYVPAPSDIALANIVIKEGTVGRLAHRYHGFRAEADAEPFITIEVNWMMGRQEMLPDGADPDDYYVISIEGRPSVRVGIDIKSSLATGAREMIPGDPTSEPGYYATVATILQAVPRVSAAEPGVLQGATPDGHWAPDLHQLAGADLEPA